jgi:hypothetical protein
MAFIRIFYYCILAIPLKAGFSATKPARPKYITISESYITAEMS